MYTRLLLIAVTTTVTCGSSMYFFSFTVRSCASWLGVLPDASISPSNGSDILPSGRTGTVLEKSGSFQTATLSMSSGPITYVGSSVADFVGVSFAVFPCDQAGSEQIANKRTSASLFIPTYPPAARPVLTGSSQFLEAYTKVPYS